MPEFGKAEAASLGLFAYPALMAADILAYHATMVPVGEDQKQHLELTRDIAIKFNNDFKVDFFPVVDPLIEGAATRVMSLRDGTKKMSKSDPSDQSRINLTDDADQIAAKIRKAKTDPDAPRHQQFSTFIVELPNPGYRIVRDIGTMAAEGPLSHVLGGGHSEIEIKDLVVPAENLLGGEGRGFDMGQHRLAYGRL
eukprot:gene6565-8165_t